MVLETDANVIAGKVAMQSAEASGSLSEQVRRNMTTTKLPSSKAIIFISIMRLTIFWILYCRH